MVESEKSERHSVSRCRSDHDSAEGEGGIGQGRACLQTQVLVQFDEDCFDVRGVGSRRPEADVSRVPVGWRISDCNRLRKRHVNEFRKNYCSDTNQKSQSKQKPQAPNANHIQSNSPQKTPQTTTEADRPQRCKEPAPDSRVEFGCNNPCFS